MISPENVYIEAKKLEDENLRFRTFLKIHADPDELDRQFLELHKELFTGYDCCKCGNCCRAFSTVLQEEEISAIASQLGMERQEFITQCLIEGEDGWVLPAPCRFLGMDGKCQIQDQKPEECRGFPYTDRPERLWSLYSILSSAEVCPVVFEILERLKVQYHFRRNRNDKRRG